MKLGRAGLWWPLCRPPPSHPSPPTQSQGPSRPGWHAHQSSGQVARWGQTPWAKAEGQRPASVTWQPWDTHLQASSQAMPDIKSCSCRPWPSLNAWHGPSMFSEAANVSCLAVAWAPPPLRGLHWLSEAQTRRALLGQRSRLQEAQLYPCSYPWAPGLPAIPTSFLCSEEVGPSELKAHCDGAEDPA